MPTYEKPMARVPIVPDDFLNQEVHKDHELVMDFKENDIYIKQGEGYVNITGQIKNAIKEIKDGSMVVHLVTEDTLPPIRDRQENHWYFVITKSSTSGGTIQSGSYVYYGTVEGYSHDKNYVLISQNIITESGIVKLDVKEGYSACFYVPITMVPIFKYQDTKQNIPFHIEDRIYALDAISGTYISYDVYVLDVESPKEFLVNVTLSGSDYFVVSFDTAQDVMGFRAPEDIAVRSGDSIGEQLPGEPYKLDPRYVFKGWSTDKIAKNLITSSYKPESNMTLYAWWELVTDPSYLSYYSTYYSSTGEEVNNE